MTNTSAVLAVVVYDETADGEDGGDSDERWRSVAEETIRGEGIDRGSLDLILVDRPAIHELNRDHLGVDSPTDVLAFPIDGPDASQLTSDSAACHLGDVVVCPAVAEAQAGDHAGIFDAEMTLLIVHGILHVLGHDHYEPHDALAMQSRERHHLARYGYRHPVPA